MSWRFVAVVGVVASLLVSAAGAAVWATSGGDDGDPSAPAGGEAAMADGSDYGLPRSSERAEATTVTAATTATTPTTGRPAAPAGVAAPSTTAPRPTSAERATATSAPATTSAAPSSGSIPVVMGAVLGTVPGTVALPWTVPRSSWSGTSNGVTFDVVIPTSYPKAGDEVTFTVTASHPTLQCCSLTMQTSDARTWPLVPAGIGGTCLTSGYQFGPYTRTATFIFNQAARFQFQVLATTTSCTNAMAAAEMAGRGATAAGSGPTGALTGWIEILPGVTTGQGPALPSIKLLTSNPSLLPTGLFPLRAEIRDPDGYVRRFTVDWGDGSPVETFAVTHFNPCDGNPSGWPVSHVMWGLPPNSPAYHQYATPGPHTVTATVYSTACDGSMEQSGAARLEWS